MHAFVFNLFIMAVLGLHCSLGFSLVVASWGCSLVEVRRLLTVVASLVEDRLQGMRLPGSRAQAQ